MCWQTVWARSIRIWVISTFCNICCKRRVGIVSARAVVSCKCLNSNIVSFLVESLISLSTTIVIASRWWFLAWAILCNVKFISTYLAIGGLCPFIKWKALLSSHCSLIAVCFYCKWRTTVPTYFPLMMCQQSNISWLQILENPKAPLLECQMCYIALHHMWSVQV